MPREKEWQTTLRYIKPPPVSLTAMKREISFNVRILRFEDGTAKQMQDGIFASSKLQFYVWSCVSKSVHVARYRSQVRIVTLFVMNPYTLMSLCIYGLWPLCFLCVDAHLSVVQSMNQQKMICTGSYSARSIGIGKRQFTL